MSVRAFGDGDWPVFRRVDEIAFGYSNPEPDDSPDLRILDHERSLIGEVDGVPAGVASAYGFTVSLPGGAAVPAAGVTWVGVLPTHRRRGLLRAMMERALADSADRGDVAAVLWATEPAIYRRFGFGVATRALRLTVAADGALDRAPYDPGIAVSVQEPARAREAMASVYDEAARQRPASTSRDVRWWDRSLHDPEHRRGGHSEKRVLVAERAGAAVGYATYSTSISWLGPGTPDGTLTIRELVAVDAAARAALWRVLLSHDLMRRVEWANAPTDEPLLEWVDDRAAVRGLADQMHVRLLDVPAALQARTYAAPFDLVLDVTDPLIPANSRRWLLAASADGTARCEPTDDAADLELDVDVLGALSLGARSLSALASAGRVGVRDQQRVAAAGRGLRHEPDAWCPAVF